MPTELEKLAVYFGDNTLGAKMLFGVRISKGKVNLSSIELEDDVKEGFREAFLKRIGQLIQYRTIINYNPNGFGVDEVHKLKISLIPTAQELIQDASKKVWKFDEKFIKKIKFIVLRFMNSNQEIVSVFKFYPKTKFLARHKAYIFTSGTLKFTKYNILSLAPSIDCITVGEDMLIINRNQFEKIFNYNLIYLDNANSLFTWFNQNSEFNIVNMDVLKEKTTKTLSKLRRLHNIYTSNSFNAYNFALIKRINSDYDLGINFEDNNGTKTITFPNPTTFMDVYEDAYLKSPYTDRRYIALSKRKMQQ